MKPLAEYKQCQAGAFCLADSANRDIENNEDHKFSCSTVNTCVEGLPVGESCFCGDQFFSEKQNICVGNNTCVKLEYQAVTIPTTCSFPFMGNTGAATSTWSNGECATSSGTMTPVPTTLAKTSTCFGHSKCSHQFFGVAEYIKVPDACEMHLHLENVDSNACQTATRAVGITEANDKFWRLKTNRCEDYPGWKTIQDVGTCETAARWDYSTRTPLYTKPDETAVLEDDPHVYGCYYNGLGLFVNINKEGKSCDSSYNHCLCVRDPTGPCTTPISNNELESICQQNASIQINDVQNSKPCECVVF